MGGFFGGKGVEKHMLRVISKERDSFNKNSADVEACQTPNNTQYINIPILCLQIFEISCDIYHVRKNGNPVFWIRMWYVRIHAYQTKWWLPVMLTISEIIYQPWPCISSPRWICKILCTWNRNGDVFLRGNKTCQEILCAHYITCTHACIAQDFRFLLSGCGESWNTRVFNKRQDSKTKKIRFLYGFF